MQLEPIVSPLNRVTELASKNQAIVDLRPTVSSWTMHNHHLYPQMTLSPSSTPPPGMISESETKRYVPYPWGVSGGLWASQATTGNPTSGTPWTVSKDAPVHIVDAGTIPKEIVFIQHAEDDVSVLNDDPDHDDEDILPQPTYDVLVTLFHDIYKDDSYSGMDECDDNDDEEEDVYDYHQDERAA
jgi:hypothetical protein